MLNEPEYAPWYARVENAPAAEIAGGGPPPGSQLPREDQLAERFAVSRTTVRKAVERLVAPGLSRKSPFDPTGDFVHVIRIARRA